MTHLRIALEWFLNPDHLPLLAARERLQAAGWNIELVIPDDHYDGFAALADGAVDLVVNEPLHLVEQRDLALTSHGCFFATDGGVLMHRGALKRLTEGAPVRIASPVSNPTIDGLCADILRGWMAGEGAALGSDQVRIEAAGFNHVDNLADGFDGAWLAFAKQDTGDDLAFYAPSRLVTHIDEGAVAALTQAYRHLLPVGGRLLDLMSSWVSHLPDDRDYAEVVGHGMNAVELEANPRLTRWFVQNLNQNPLLPFGDQAFDSAMACVGVQYLQQPLAVFAEVRRVLAPGAPFIVSFSNRCFPTKAVAIWRALDTGGQTALVKLYLERAGFTNISANLLADGAASDPLVAVIGLAPQP